MRQEDVSNLQQFVEACKAKGASDEFLAALLARRGWAAGDIYAALGSFWERTTGLAVPERAGSAESARDAFLYLLSFSTLATWTAAIGSMLFEFINHWFPDAVSTSYVYDLRSAVTWQMASVAVAFPIFLLVMRTILREAAAQPERLESGVRKWLTYIALLCAAGAMICDLIWFLDYFLTGELTVRFVLKAAAVMLIAAAVFTYYLGSLRWNRTANLESVRLRSRIFAAGACLAVLATFLVGLGVAGTPSKQRRMEADKKRVEDLRNLAYAIKRWHDEDPGKGIPAALSALKPPLPRLTDPESKTAYEYYPGAGAAYQLCSTFASEERNADRYPSGFWQHPQGRACFSLDAGKPVSY